MHTCEICGRKSNKKYKAFGYVLCQKHKRQIMRQGRFLDNNPRTVNDLNEYRIEGDVVYVSLYNQNCDKIAEFVVDLYDFPQIRYKKWRLSHGRVVTGTAAKKIRGVENVIFDMDPPHNIFHIDGDPLNCTRENLLVEI